MFPIIDEFTFKKPLEFTFQEVPKHAESDRDTRNPTTHKKNFHFYPNYVHQQPEQAQDYQHFYRSSEHQQHPQQRERHRKQQRRGRNMWEGRCQSSKHQRSHSAHIPRNHKRATTLEQQHRQERKDVTMAFRAELKTLKESWRHLLDCFRERELKIMTFFKQLQEKSVEKARERLQHRCERERSPSPSSRMQELAKVQQIMMKMNDFKGLAHIKKQMQNEAAIQRRRREEKIQRWRKAQEQKLTSEQQKKYSALTIKLEDLRQDKERAYIRDQKRLKQKFKNVIAKMEHCQALDIGLLY